MDDERGIDALFTKSTRRFCRNRRHTAPTNDTLLT
jgi:hypothetical protein